MKKNHLSILSIGAVLSIVLFTGCLKSHSDNMNPDVAGLMAFNLAPDKTVSLNIGGSILTASPLTFNSYTGGYLSIYPGNRPLEAFDFNTGASLGATTYDFQAKKYYSAFVVGSGGTYQNVIVNDNLDSLSDSSGKAYVRYINAIVGSANPTVTITTGGDNVANGNAAFATVSDFVAVTPGDITVTVNDGASVNINRTFPTESKRIYTVLLIPGATSSDPAQIKYIVNGTLDGVSGKSMSSATQVPNYKVAL